MTHVSRDEEEVHDAEEVHHAEEVHRPQAGGSEEDHRPEVLREEDHGEEAGRSEVHAEEEHGAQARGSEDHAEEEHRAEVVGEEVDRSEEDDRQEADVVLGPAAVSKHDPRKGGFIAPLPPFRRVPVLGCSPRTVADGHDLSRSSRRT